MKEYITLKAALFFAVMMSWSASMMGQGINGIVVDSNSATVVLQTADSVFVDATVSKEDGSFAFSNSDVPFILTVQHIAYNNLQQLFRDASVGEIVLAPGEEYLTEAVVSASKPYVKVEDGKFLYDTRDLVRNHIADNAWELLNKIPGVYSKGSSVSLVGAGEVSVLIDGRLTTMTADQLYTMLNNTPADRVETAEIIYNAPPQYHVNGAVVNLVMRRSAISHVEGEIAADYANQYYGYGGLNANLRVGTSRTTFDFMYGINRKKSMQYSVIDYHHELNDALYDTKRKGSAASIGNMI